MIEFESYEAMRAAEKAKRDPLSALTAKLARSRGILDNPRVLRYLRRKNSLLTSSIGLSNTSETVELGLRADVMRYRGLDLQRYSRLTPRDTGVGYGMHFINDAKTKATLAARQGGRLSDFLDKATRSRAAFGMSARDELDTIKLGYYSDDREEGDMYKTAGTIGGAGVGAALGASIPSIAARTHAKGVAQQRAFIGPRQPVKVGSGGITAWSKKTNFRLSKGGLGMRAGLGLAGGIIGGMAGNALGNLFSAREELASIINLSRSLTHHDCNIALPQRIRLISFAEDPRGRDQFGMFSGGAPNPDMGSVDPNAIHATYKAPILEAQAQQAAAREELLTPHMKKINRRTPKQEQPVQ